MTPRRSSWIMRRRMDERTGWHHIEEDLNEAWLEELAAAGIAAFELYLAKHLAFLSYLDDTQLDDVAA